VYYARGIQIEVRKEFGLRLRLHAEHGKKKSKRKIYGTVPLAFKNLFVKIEKFYTRIVL